MYYVQYVSRSALCVFVSLSSLSVTHTTGLKCLVLLVTKRDRWESIPHGRAMCEHYWLTVLMYTPGMSVQSKTTAAVAHASRQTAGGV